MNPYPMFYRAVQLLLAALLFASSAQAGTISTIAGGGASYGDGGPATDAQLSLPQGVAVDLAGNVYFADFNAFVVRRIDATTGFISTIAGDGNFGYAGDGGPATAASLTSPLAVSVDISGNVYLTDQLNGRVRMVDHATGIITTVAGNGGIVYGGDGGPALLAAVPNPGGVAVDTTGQVYIADDQAARVRIVDTGGIINTIAGTGNNNHAGDGGLAVNADLQNPSRIAIDPSGNLYIVEYGISTRVRRVDHLTHIITTVAGTGAGTGTNGSSGAATAANLGGATDVAADDFGNLYIAGAYRIWKVDATGNISIVAGTGVFGFSGDGGDATLAAFGGLGGIAIAGNGDLFVSDAGNARIRKILANTPTPFDVVVDLTTTQAFLNVLASVQGSLLLVNDGTRTLLVLPVLQSVGVDFTVTGNTAVTSVAAPGLATVGGNVTVIGNPVLATVGLTGLTTVAGVVVSGNSALGTVSMPVLGGATGDITVTGNTAANAVSMPSLTSAGGNVTVSGNTAAASVDMPVLASTGGAITVSGNTSATTVSMPGLTSAGGAISVTGNTAATSIDFPAVTTAGAINISGNTSAANVTVGPVTAAGDVAITNNGSAAVTVGSATVAGSFTVDTTGATANYSGVTTTGNVDITGAGTTTLSAATGGGSTAVALLNTEATMQAVLPTGAFASRVTFSVTHLDPATLGAVPGTTPAATAVTVDPVAAYQFVFAIPTLNSPATLTFDVNVAALPAADQTALLAALASNNVTLAVLGDAPGSTYQTFAVCVGAQVPTAGGCVQIARLDANGVPTTGTPAIIRVDAVAGHFSTYAVVIVTPLPGDTVPPVLSGVPGPITADAQGPGGTYIAWASPTALDAIDGQRPVSCVPASGSLFPLGVTTVTCTAADLSGNAARKSFTVTIRDITAPALALPANITATATGAAGALVNYTATANDLVSGSVPVTCAPVSGSTFPVGVTTVSCTAVDGAGNRANGSFTVTVTAAPVPTPTPDLTISKTHAGSCTRGQSVTYTIRVGNVGTGASSGMVTVTDILPAGLSAATGRMSGKGWTCNKATASCTRSDALAAGAGYPAISLTVNALGNAPATVTNTATVSGGGDANTANNTASDPTAIVSSPDLAISKTHAGNCARGKAGCAYTITVANVGAAPSAGSVNVSDILPAGLTATAMSGTGWTCRLAGTPNCARSDALAAGASYSPITIKVNVAKKAPASVVNRAVVSGGGDVNPANNKANDPTLIN